MLVFIYCTAYLTEAMLRLAQALSKVLEERRRLQEVPADSVGGEKRLIEQIVDVVSKSSYSSSLESLLNPRTSQPSSVIVGKENAALNQCTVNITNIYLCEGTSEQIDKPDLSEILKSTPGTRMSSVSEGPQNQNLSEISSAGLPEIARKKQKQEEKFESTFLHDGLSRNRGYSDTMVAVVHATELRCTYLQQFDQSSEGNVRRRFGKDSVDTVRWLGGRLSLLFAAVTKNVLEAKAL